MMKVTFPWTVLNHTRFSFPALQKTLRVQSLLVSPVISLDSISRFCQGSGVKFSSYADFFKFSISIYFLKKKRSICLL